MTIKKQAKELGRNYGEKVEWNERKYSIHITIEETTLELFVCENVTIYISEYKDWVKVKHNYIIIIICSYVVEGS